MWCIYKHTNKINGKVYIGQTCQEPEDRWGKDGGGYDPSYPFGQAIIKYGWDNFTHEIIETSLDTIEKANEREIYWIAFYHSYLGDPLCNGYNATKGGDNRDHQGYKVVCIETGEVFDSAALAANKYGCPAHSILGCCHKKEYMNTAAKKHWCFLEEYEQNRDIILKPFNGGQDKSVYCFELNKIFDSISKASSETEVNFSCISDCCKLKRISAGGYHWCYTEDKEKYFPKENDLLQKIICIETQEVFDSATLAAKSVNRAASNILFACQDENRMCGGFHWKRVSPKKPSNRGGQNKKAVLCITNNTIYQSAAEAARETGCNAGSIRECCKGKLNKTKDKNKNFYYWKYID